MIRFVKNVWRGSIQRQLVLGIALVHAILMTIFVTDLVSRQRTFLKNQSVEQTEALAISLAANSVSWVLADDVVGLEEIILSIKKFPDLEYAMILSPQGKVLAHTDNSRVGLFVQDAVSLSLFDNKNAKHLVNDTKLLDIGVPIISAGKHIGWARVGISQKILHTGLQQILRDGIGYTLLAILVGSIFAIGMARGITSGIRQLLQVTHQVENGKINTHVENDRPDELGQLGKSFNKMIDRIRQFIRDLEQSQQLALSEKEKTQAYLNTAMVAVLVLDLKGDIALANPHCLNILKLKEAEILGKNWFKTCIPQETGNERHHHYLNGLKTQDIANLQFESSVLTKDNEIRIMDWRNTYLFDPNGNVTGMLRSGIDITKRKQAELALQESEEFLRTIIENIPNMIFVKDAKDLRFVRFNKAGEELIGYPREELIGKNDYDLFPKGEADFFTNKDRQVLSTEKFIDISEERIQTKYKGERILRTKKIPLLDNNEQPLYLLGISEDITDYKQLETQLQQSQKMESIGTLAGGIAHDFNNILFPIVGNTEILLEDIPKDSPFRDYLTEIFDGAMRARDLVKQILAFSRQDRLEIKPIRIQPVIKQALKLIRSTIPASIEIKQTISHNCGTIKADPTQIHQVVMNLATNAYHAMENNGGELKVTLKKIEIGKQDLPCPDIEPGSYACLTVADTGTGIDESLRGKIFDPYFTTKKQGKGTGMGLSVVHGIVKNTGGDIHVNSTPGIGTEFHVFLPVEKNQIKQSEIQKKVPIQGGTEQILLVDDEDAIAFMEKEILERLGYSVVAFTNSIEAMEAFRANPEKFDLVITDMAMPNMTGDRLASELMKIRADIPILICTGFSKKLPEEKAKSMGIHGLLMKPIVMKDFALKIREVLAENKL